MQTSQTVRDDRRCLLSPRGARRAHTFLPPPGAPRKAQQTGGPCASAAPTPGGLCAAWTRSNPGCAAAAVSRWGTRSAPLEGCAVGSNPCNLVEEHPESRLGNLSHIAFTVSGALPGHVPCLHIFLLKEWGFLALRFHKRLLFHTFYVSSPLRRV